MPRNGKGGVRELPAGKVSATRTDMNARQPVLVPASPVYGAGVASEDAQRAVPLPQADQLPPGGAPAGPAAAAGPARPLPPQLTGPTRRPDEPVTAGIDMGAGPGSEALGMASATPDLGRLANYLPVLEVLASRPGTTQDMRNFVRLVRSNAPTGG